MSDLISRQDAIEAVQNRHMMLTKEKVLLINDLEKLSPAEPQIIRCKDCKHLSNDRITPEFNRVCRLYGCGKKEYGFCDGGERRTDE